MERPRGSLRTRVVHTAMIADREARKDTPIEVKELLRERGKLSAAKGMALVALRHSRIPVGEIANRLMGPRDRELVGVGFSTFVYEGSDPDKVEKFTAIGPENADEVWDAYETDADLASEIYGHMYVPTELSIELGNIGRLKGPFVKQIQPRVEGEDLFEALQHADDLVPEIERFLGAYYHAMDRHGRIADLRGTDNIFVDRSSGAPQIKVVDTGFHSIHEGEPGYIRPGRDERRQVERVAMLHAAIE